MLCSSGPRGPAAAGPRVRHPQDPRESWTQAIRHRLLGDTRGFRCKTFPYFYYIIPTVRTVVS